METVAQQRGDGISTAPNRNVAGCAAEFQPSTDACEGSSRIESSYAGNPNMMKIIVEFVDTLPGEVRKLLTLLERNELRPLQRVVHQLLGSCGGYGFSDVNAPAAQAEESIKKNMPLELIRGEIISLISVIRRIEGYDESKMPLKPS